MDLMSRHMNLWIDIANIVKHEISTRRNPFMKRILKHLAYNNAPFEALLPVKKCNPRIHQVINYFFNSVLKEKTILKISLSALKKLFNY